MLALTLLGLDGSVYKISLAGFVQLVTDVKYLWPNGTS